MLLKHLLLVVLLNLARDSIEVKADLGMNLEGMIH